MRRLLAIAVVAGLAAAAVGLAWRWWTAPPRAPYAVLAAALAVAPGHADGALALAQPGRWVRWLASHPQALAPLRIAAPSAEKSLARLRGVLVALAREARGPVTVWWSGGELAAGAAVGGGTARALQRLAAIEGLPFAADAAPAGTLVTIASAPSLLARGSAPAAGGSGALGALARVRGRLWRVEVARTSLELLSGAPPALPAADGTDLLATTDLAALAAPLTSAAWVPRAPAIVSFDSEGWAVSLPATDLPREVERVLSFGGTAAATPTGVARWRGLLGELWVRQGRGTAVASRPDLLAGLPEPAAAGESGRIRGPDLARVCRQIAAVCEHVPGGGGVAADLRRAANALVGVRLARWRLVAEGGGRILLEW